MVDFDYRQSMDRDTLEQFRGQSNIQVLHDVLAKQLQDVYDFFLQLNNDRNLSNSVGAQLDGIGDIVVLSRREAGDLSACSRGGETDDDTYHKYLIYKILKNTCNCTYPDIIKAFRMFWDRPLYYTEDPEQPATMIFDTGEITADVDITPLIQTPIIKAAGVTVKLIFRIVCRTPAALYIGGGVGTAVRLGGYQAADTFGFRHIFRAGGVLSSLSAIPMPEDTAPPSATTILRTGGVCTIISNLSKGD